MNNKSNATKRYKSVLTGPVTTTEPKFLHDIGMDRMVGAFVALASEVYILRDRLGALEAVLENAKTIPEGAVEALEETPEQSKTRQDDAQGFVTRVLSELHRSDVPISHIGRKTREMADG
jgi:hypothetical protein